MPDDHSELVPLLPIPNRTVKRLSADDSADSRVKVGHRQALTALQPLLIHSVRRGLVPRFPRLARGCLENIYHKVFSKHLQFGTE